MSDTVVSKELIPLQQHSQSPLGAKVLASKCNYIKEAKRRGKTRQKKGTPLKKMGMSN